MNDVERFDPDLLARVKKFVHERTGEPRVRTFMNSWTAKRSQPVTPKRLALFPSTARRQTASDEPRRVSASCAVAVICAGLVLILGGCGYQFSGLPSDDKLIQNFNESRPQIQKLLAMANTDSKVIRISPTFTRLKDNWAWPRPLSTLGFTEERWDEYKMLFKKAGITEGLEREDDGSLFFIVSVAGFGNGHGKDKGYVHLSDPARRTVITLPSLDDNQVDKFFKTNPDFGNHALLVRPLTDSWYLYIST